MMSEVEALSELESKHVVRLYMVVETEARLCLALEFGEGGDLWVPLPTEPRAPDQAPRVPLLAGLPTNRASMLSLGPCSFSDCILFLSRLFPC